MMALVSTVPADEITPVRVAHEFAWTHFAERREVEHIWVKDGETRFSLVDGVSVYGIKYLPGNPSVYEIHQVNPPNGGSGSEVQDETDRESD